jgi:outer membrane protein OmpA-like peptidoglycan-associated protein
MKKITFVVLLILLLSLLGYAQEKSKRIKYHAFSGTLMIGAEAGMTLGYTDYITTKPQVVGRGIAEYFFPTTSNGIFGIKGFMSAGYVGGKDDRKNPDVFRSNIIRLGGGISYTFSLKENIFPYVFLGASYGWVNPRDNNSVDLPYTHRTFSIKDVNYHAEVGLRFLLSNEINFNVNAGAELSSKDHWDALPPFGNNDMLIQIMAGFSYSFFTQNDEDGDGVPDSKDQCPGTPPGVKVDDFGCPLDSDNDGVPDYKDKCPNTKPGMKVDENGCVIDSDNDGVPDEIDKCPNTPPGMKVNEYGCPDTDNDGVYDDMDKCPETPAGAPVDATGCPKDSDGDGVPDYKDECPNTPKGQQVDDKGCATKKDTVKVTLSGDTNFEFNKAELLPNAYPILNKVAESLKSDQNAKLRIEGYTDAIGSDSYNMELSRKRAQAVADYLISQGISSSRLQVVPMGESNPVATNKTAEGRAMNRRVEIIPQ